MTDHHQHRQIVDLFAGCGGWSEGLRNLSPEMHERETGIEYDQNAAATRTAARHRTIIADVSQIDPHRFSDVEGLIASPPCQDFSSAGTKQGMSGERGSLISEVLRWTDALRPDWIACEQVIGALPVWEQYATELRRWGYTAWTGILNAADFGVPQRRPRAILLASSDHDRSLAPIPTHSRNPQDELFADSRLPWITVKDALSDRLDPPHWTINTGCSFRVKGDRDTALCFDGASLPALTLTGQSCNQWQVGRRNGSGLKLSEIDTLRLMSFPDDYPVQGSSQAVRQQQIGNAVPPLLAERLLSAVTGISSP